MSFFAQNAPNMNIAGQKLHSGAATHEMGSPSRMLRGYESALTHDFSADQYRRKIREQDAYLQGPAGRFGNLDRLAKREEWKMYEEAHKQQAQQERAKQFYQQMLMEPYSREVEESNRARALGYDNAASMRELNNSRNFSKSQQAALLSGLAAMFAPFAQSGATASTDITRLLGGLLDDTDITMRDNAMNPIGGVMARYRRPASNTYGAT